MNTSDLHTLLTVPPVSRATFFTQLLAQPRPPRELPFEEPTSDGITEPIASIVAAPQPYVTGFPA